MSKWCECKPLTTTEALNLGASVDWSLLHKKICPRCQKPIKSKRELPEKMEPFGYTGQDIKIVENRTKINEIIDYLKEA